MNIRKHWKKLLLTTTALFWASCTSENENTFPTIGQDTPHAVDPSASSDSHIESSSEKAVESSSSEAKAPSSSSELTQVMPAYGVYDKVSCYLDDKDKGIKASTSSRGVFEYSYHCENGVNCVARDSVTGYEPEYPCKENSITKQMICLDYGVIATTETTISCDDGKTYSEEEFRKQYNRLYTIKNNQEESSSSVAESSSSAEVTCAPTDSVISYYPPDYSESVAKSNAEEKANRAGVAKIDSIMKAQETIPQALANLRQQLSMFVALYGAPVLIHPDEVCSDGITRPTQAYLDYLKMKEEWEKNKPALDEECQKIYEDKLKEIEQSIKECLESSNPSTDLTACDLKTMCPLYGIDSKCSYKYNCVDDVSCEEIDGDSTKYCTDKQGEKIKYTQEEFEKKYYTKSRY